MHLEDCTDSNEIKKLSVKELKALLDENFVDYKGCCEKDELVQRALMLWESKKVQGNGMFFAVAAAILKGSYLQPFPEIVY